MSLERVLGFFESKGMAERVLILDESSATVELAAHALHCPPERIAKTLSFLVGDRPVLVVMAGDAKVNNSKFKAVFKEKARMLTAEQAEALVGHAVGGVCPFAVNEGVQVYLDDSLKRFETVFPACGSGNSAIELTIAGIGNPFKLHFLCGCDEIAGGLSFREGSGRTVRVYGAQGCWRQAAGCKKEKERRSFKALTEF